MKPPRKDICDCGTLESWSKEPDHPVRFNATLNEYFIADKAGSEYSIYYCPFCGGAAPESRRSSLFAQVTEKEQARIWALFSGISFEWQVLERFGPPDEERQIGRMVIYPEKDGQPARGEALRTLVYKHLSDVADVHFNISDGGNARGIWEQKYIAEPGGRHDGSDGPPASGSSCPCR